LSIEKLAKGLNSRKNNTTQVVALAVAIVIIAAVSSIITNTGIFEQDSDTNDSFVIHTESWVPISVLRDPPGSDSYSKLFLRDSNNSTLRFDSNVEGVNVTGEFSSRLIQGDFCTSEFNNSDFVLLVKLNLIWNISSNSNIASDDIDVELIFCEILSEPQMFSIECASDIGVWVLHPPSGIAGIRHSSQAARSQRVEEFRFSRNPHSWKQFQDIRAGFYIDLLEESIPISISLDLGGSTLCTKTYGYYESHTMDYTVMSDGPMDHQYPDLYICSGMLLWFES
jgi:hypothetical protein